MFYENYEEIYLAAWDLIEDVAIKYNIKTYDDFTCKYMETLARKIEYFNGEQRTDTE